MPQTAEGSTAVDNLGSGSTTDNIRQNEDIEDNVEIKNVSFGRALCIPGVIGFSLSFFFIKFAYYGLYYWVPTYL